MAVTSSLQRDSGYDVPEPPLQLEKLFKFQQRVFFDMSAALCALAAYLGDRLGLFRALAEQGWVSSSKLAATRQICPEMTAEWLRVMTCAGYLDYDPQEDRYSLPAEHAMILSNGGPTCFAGGLQQIGAFAEQLPQLLHALQQGGGVPQAAYPIDLRDGMERLSATWFDHELVEHWVSALPVADLLRRGGTVADAGCGGGLALICLAKAFPAARFVGYDLFPASVERATRNATAAGVGDRVRFEVRDVLKGIPDEFDVVTAFDALHDFSDPAQGIAALARALKKDGTMLILEIGGGIDFREQAGPVGVVLHATKLFYNLPVALAAFGKAHDVQFNEATMKSLCRQAGLVLQRTLPVRNPLHVLYIVKAAQY